MPITKIKISNFKSFRDVEVHLANFNILIGPNASGKSNFIQALRFLRDIANHGLNDAISMQGDIEFLRNIIIGASQPISFDIFSQEELQFRKESEGQELRVKTYELIYEFALKSRKKGRGFEISKDKLTQKCEFFEIERTKGKIIKEQKLSEGEIVLSIVNRKVNFELNLVPRVSISKDDIFPPFLKAEELPPKTLLLEAPFLFVFPFIPLQNILRQVSIYDFDPRLPKRAASITGKAELEEDGKNLAVVLKNIKEDKEKKRKLFNLIKDVLHFVDDLDVVTYADKSLLFKLREIYDKKIFLPASLVSDGTINITALIIALYFEEKPLIIIEEPERNIHPFLISRTVNMMKEASERKQIIITSHNPEIVKYADIKDILLIARDKEGFSTVSKPSEKEEIKTFLKNKLGIEELFVMNLLGI